MNDEVVTTIDLLRHGSCDGPSDIFRGRTDTPLSDKGLIQMHNAIDGIDGKWQRIVTSPLQRCYKFAELLANTWEIPLQIEDELQEVDFGDWEGRRLEDIWNKDPSIAKAFYSDPESVVHKGESMIQFRDRVLECWSRLLEQHEGERILMVLHGGSLRVLLTAVMNTPIESIASINVPYACLSRVKIFHHDGELRPVLFFHNRMASINEG